MTLSLPTPDPTEWILLSGSIRSLGSTSARAAFQPGDLEPHQFAGSVRQRDELFDQSGTSLTMIERSVFPVCGETVSFCSGSDAMPSDEYTAIADDPAVLGPLTLRYQFARNWNANPISETLRVNWITDFRLVYSPVPEPGSALLLIAGLLGLAGWRRTEAR